jgi:hypothetical protein
VDVTIHSNSSFTMAPSLSSLRSLIGLQTTESPHRLCSELGEVHTEGGQSSFVPRNESDIDAWYKDNLPEVTGRLITPTEGQVFVCLPHDENGRYFYPILRAAINEHPFTVTKASSLVVRQDNEEERLNGLCQITSLGGSLSQIRSKVYPRKIHYLTQRYDLKYQGPLGSRPTGKTKTSLTVAYKLTDKGTVAYDIPGTLAAWTEGGRLHWVPKEPVCEPTIHPITHNRESSQASS